MSEDDAAAKYGVDVTTVRRADKRWKDGRFKFEGFDPVDAVRDYLLRLAQIASHLELERMTSSDPSTRIDALTAKLGALKESTRVMLEFGLIPRVDPSADAWRQEHAAQIQAWLRSKARGEGWEEDVANELADWAAEGIEDWLKNAPTGLWSKKGDTFTHKDVRQGSPD
jgi:hypothetical protein